MGRQCRAASLWPLLFLTLMFIVVLVTMDHASTGIFIFFGFILGLFLWYWIGILLVLDRDCDWDNNNNNDERRRGSQIGDIESNHHSHTHTSSLSLPVTATARVRAQSQREPWQDVHLFSFAPRAHIARLSMRALPPVTCFRGGDGDGSDQLDCPICMEDFENGELVQPFGVCVHEFHSSCVNSWLLGGKTTCPVCRKELSITVD